MHPIGEGNSTVLSIRVISSCDRITQFPVTRAIGSKRNVMRMQLVVNNADISYSFCSFWSWNLIRGRNWDRHDTIFGKFCKNTDSSAIFLSIRRKRNESKRQSIARIIIIGKLIALFVHKLNRLTSFSIDVCDERLIFPNKMISYLRWSWLIYAGSYLIVVALPIFKRLNFNCFILWLVLEFSLCTVIWDVLALKHVSFYCRLI